MALSTKKKQIVGSKNSRVDVEDVQEHEGFKFPRTRHLFDAGGGGVGRDDLLMDPTDAARWYRSEICIEEKVDGANLGISYDETTGRFLFKNRSHWVTAASASQFRALDSWLESKRADLWELFSAHKDIVLFGEWLYAQHSIRYTRLPDLFLAFDIYDLKTKRFFTTAERDELLQRTNIKTVRQIHRGTPEMRRDRNKEMLF